MSSNSEKGHAKNVANFKLLTTYITGLGAAYNPSNPEIEITQLESLYDNAFLKQKNVNTSEAPYKNAAAERENFFAPLNKLITKLRGVFKSTLGVQPNQLDNFMTIARKIKGSKKSKNPPTIDTPETDAIQAQHSASQRSYDQQTNNFEILIALLESTPNYNPNEVEYKIVTLKNRYTKMLNYTEKVGETFTPFNTARSERNKVIYYNQNNLIDIALTTKSYISTIVDKSSSEYKAIAKLRFTRIKK